MGRRGGAAEMAESKGQKSGRQNEYLNKKIIFYARKFLNYCDKTGHSINVFFFSFIIYVRSGNFDYWPPAPNNVVTLMGMFMIPCNFPVTSQCHSYLCDLSAYLLTVLYLSGHNTAQSQPDRVKVILHKTTQK
jgi:hypothetical protein